MGVMGGDTHGQPVDRRQCCVVMVERKRRKVGTLKRDTLQSVCTMNDGQWVDV